MRQQFEGLLTNPKKFPSNPKGSIKPWFRVAVIYLVVQCIGR